jgi:hypothetical protein
MRRTPRLAILLAIATAAAIGAANEAQPPEQWTPRHRPDRAFSSAWEFLGCKAGTIDYGFVGEIPGFVCSWRRSSDDFVAVIREERYSPSGEFHIAYERTEDGAEEYQVIFFDHGRGHFRLSESTSQRRPFVADVVVKGAVSARYASSWDRIIADSDGRLVGVPMDTRRLWGEPFPPIETFRARGDERKIHALREAGIDLSKPQLVEFGLWFDDKQLAGAKSGLLALGCRWLTVEERHGTIGPFPGHCAMTTVVEGANLSTLHDRFTRFAQNHGGRYYGWTTVNMRSNSALNASHSVVTALAQGGKRRAARPAG